MLLSGILRKKIKILVPVFPGKTENVIADVPLRNLCEIIPASVNYETGKSRFFPLITGFKANAGMTCS